MGKQHTFGKTNPNTTRTITEPTTIAQGLRVVGSQAAYDAQTDKRDILESDYNIPMTHTMERGMSMRAT